MADQPSSDQPLAPPGGEASRQGAPVLQRPTLRTFESLSVRQVRTYLFAIFSSSFGFQSQVVVRGWLAFQLTGSPLALGAVEFTSGIANVVASPVGGILADRFERRRIIATLQALLGLSGGVLGILVLTGAIRYWHLVLVGGVNGAITGLLMPPRFAFIYNVAGRAHTANAVALSQGAIAATRLIAPAVGGALIAHAGAEWVYFLMGSGFFFSVAVLTLMVGPVAEEHQARRESPLKDLAEGLAYLWKSPMLLWLVVLGLGGQLLGEPVFQLIPAFARDALDLGAQGYGLLLTMVGVGAVTGSVVVATVAGSRRQSSVLLVTGAVWGGLVLLFALSPSAAAALPLAVLVGAASAGFSAMTTVLIQSSAADAYRGRMLSLQMVNVTPIGALATGAIAEEQGIRTGLVAPGAAIAAFALAMAAWRRALVQGAPSLAGR